MYERLGPQCLFEDESAAVYAVDSRQAFRALRRILVFLSSYAALGQAFARDPDALDRYILQLPQRQGDLALVFLGPPGNPSTVTRLLQRQAALEDQPIIPLSRLFHARRDPTAILRGILLRSVPVWQYSPYGIESVTPSEMFFGRQTMLRQLQTAKGSQIIVGPRRIGKTSIARRLEQLLGHVHQFADGREMQRCSYVDVSLLGQQASTEIWTKILEGFGLKRKDYAAGGRFAKLVRTNRRAERELIVDDGRALSRTIDAYQGQLFIILDEVDQWIEAEAPSGWPTLDRLRAMSDEGRAQVILVGYESLALAAENDRFPFVGRGNWPRVGPLAKPDIDQLVKEPLKELGVKIEGQEQVLNRIWQTSSGMPHIVQDICRHLVHLASQQRGLLRRISPPILETAINLSSTVKNLRHGVINSPLPLAEAIAGELSFAEMEAMDRILAPSPNAPPPPRAGIPNSVIASALETIGYTYDSHDFERALAYLELRYVIRSVDGTRTRWEWTNDLARTNMLQHIENTGHDRWLHSVMARHADVGWRTRYHLLEPPAKGHRR